MEAKTLGAVQLLGSIIAVVLVWQTLRQPVSMAIAVLSLVIFIMAMHHLQERPQQTRAKKKKRR